MAISAYIAHQRRGDRQLGGSHMTRTAAREIAVHFSFELGFTRQEPEELLREAFSEKKCRDELNRKQ